MSDTETSIVFLGAATVCASFFVLGLMSGASMTRLTFGFEPINKYENPVWFWLSQIGWFAMAIFFAWIGVGILL